jgi:hypothetical protein
LKVSAPPWFTQVPLLAVVAVAVAVMSAWLQLVVSMVSATGAVTAMHWAAFLLCNLAAALLLLLLAFQRGKATAAKSKQGAWALQLLQASLVSAAAAEMQQVAAEAGVPAPREAEEAEQGAAAAEDRLPKSFRCGVPGMAFCCTAAAALCHAASWPLCAHPACFHASSAACSPSSPLAFMPCALSP